MVYEFEVHSVAIQHIYTLGGAHPLSGVTRKRNYSIADHSPHAVLFSPRPINFITKSVCLHLFRSHYSNS